MPSYLDRLLMGTILFGFATLPLSTQSFGYGYQAGGSIGVQFDAIRVQVTSVFTDIIAKTKASADTYYKLDYSDGTVDKDSDFEKKFVSRLRGVSIGIGGSYSM